MSFLYGKTLNDALEACLRLVQVDAYAVPKWSKDWDTLLQRGYIKKQGKGPHDKQVVVITQKGRSMLKKLTPWRKGGK
jgi:hypothetical protein